MITFEVIISFFVICETEYSALPEKLQIALLLFSNIISVSYIHIPIWVKLSNFAQYLYYFSYLPRPYILLSQDSQKILQQATFSIIIIIFIAQLTLSLMISALITQQHKQLFNYLQNSNFYLKFICKIIALEKQLIYSLYFQPVIEILLYGLHSLNYIEVTSYFNFFLSIFAICIFTLQALLRLYFIEETISLKIQGFQKLNINLYEFFIFLLKFIQVLIFSIAQNQSINLYFQPIISLSISILIIINSLSQFQTPNNNHLKTILIGQGFSLSIQLSSIAFFVVKHKQYELTTSIILIPIIIQLLLMLKNENELRIILRIHQSHDPRLLQLYLTQIINKQKNQKSLQLIQNAILLYKHHEECQEPTCFCNQFKVFSEAVNQVNMIIEPLQSEITKNSIMQFNSALQQQSHKSEKFMYLLHYTSALNELGQSIFAIKQINVLLNEKENNRIVSSVENTNLMISNDRHSYKRKSFLNFGIKTIKTEEIQNFLAKANFAMTSIQKLKSKILKQLITYRLLNKLQQSCIQKEIIQSEVKVSVSLFLQSETMREELKVMIIQSLKNKQQFFLDLTTRITNAKDLFKFSKKITKDFIKIEKQLNKIYSNYPSQSMQSLSSFFHAEIFNNFLEAFKIGGTGSISDEKLMTNQQYLPINLFSKNVGWISSTYNDKNSSLIISKVSRNLFELLKYKSEEIHKLIQVEQLMPTFIGDIHMSYVDSFLQTGISKFFDNVAISFCQFKNGFIHPIEMFYTINPLARQNIEFITFFQFMQTQNIYILLDENCYIGGVSQNLLHQIHYNQNLINVVDIRKLFNGIHINCLIPTFNQLIKGTKMLESHQQKLENFTFYFLKEEIIKLYFQSHLPLLTFRTQTNQSHHSLWKDQLNLNQFSCSLTLTKNSYGQSYHYILHIYEIRQQQSMYQQAIQIQIKDAISIKSKKQKMLDSYSHSSNDSSIDKEIDQINQIDISEHPANFVQKSLVNKNEDTFLQKIQQKCIEIHEVIELDNNDFEMLQAQQYNSQVNFIKSIDNTNGITQQRFFQDFYTHPVGAQQYSDIVDNDENSVNNNIKYDADLDQKMQNFIVFGEKAKDMDHGFDQSENHSSSQSEIGIRKSIFSKNYEVMQRIIQSNRLPPSLKGMILFMVLMLGITFIYSLIGLFTVQTNIEKFSQQSDMLSIRAFFMGPFDEYMTTRYRLFIYGNMLKAGEMKQERYNFLKIFPRYELALGYSNLRTNFFKQLENPLLFEFIKDRTMNVTFMGISPVNLEYYNLSMRASLNVLLSYSYMYKIGYEQGRPITGTNFLVHQYTNMLKLIAEFKDLSETIRISLQSNSLNLQIQWIQLWIIFLSFAFILVSLSLVFLRIYFRRYEKILELFSFIDIYWVNRDLERYQILLNFLKKDEDVIYKYNFNLNKKETFILSEKEKFDTMKKSKNKKEPLQIKSFELQQFLNYTIYFLIFTVFLIMSTTQTIIIFTFSNKYRSSVDLYKDMSELRYNIPGPFAYRDMEYNWQIFPFFKPTDRVFYLDLFFTAIQKQEEFISFIGNFDPQLYLVSDSFIDQFYKLREGNLCNYIPDDMKNITKYYCEVEFGGVMQRGLLSTLLALCTSLKNEVKVNNFTKRIGDPIQDSEVALITVYVVNDLTTLMKDGMNKITENSIHDANAISFCYLGFSIIALLMLLLVITLYYGSEMKIVKKFIFLLPQALLLVDYSLERQLKVLAIGEPND